MRCDPTASVRLGALEGAGASSPPPPHAVIDIGTMLPAASMPSHWRRSRICDMVCPSGSCDGVQCWSGDCHELNACELDGRDHPRKPHDRSLLPARRHLSIYL